MIKVLDKYRIDIEGMCRLYQVKVLHAFGSVVTEHFDSSRSDVDLLVQFSDELSPSEYAACFFRLQADLEVLLGRSVDLITPQSLNNPYFKATVEASERLLYAA